MSRWFNPNDPVEVGLEWQDATRMITEPVDYAREIGHKFTLPQTLTVEGVKWYSPGPVQSSNPNSLFYENWVLATIYEAGREREYELPLSAQVPIATGSSTSGTVMGNTVLGPATTAQEALSALDQAYVELTTNQTIDARFNPLDYTTISNPRIINVTFDVYAAPVVTGTTLAFGFRAHGGLAFELASAPHPASRGGHVYSWSTGEIFLAAYDWLSVIQDDRRRPWLVKDFNDMAAGNVQFYIRNVGPETVDINWVSMSVDYCTENRLAVGGQERGARHVSFTHSINAWQTGIELNDVKAPGIGINLLQGREYVLTLTRATDAYLAEQVLEQNNSPRYQSGLARDIAAIAGANGYPLQSVEYQRDTRGLIISDAQPVDRGYALGLQAFGSTDLLQNASNPYVSTIGVGVSGDFNQQVLSTASGVYKYVRFPVRKFGQPAALQITVGGSTAQFTSDEYDALAHDANGWTLAQVELNPPLVISANTNTVIEANVSQGDNRWEIPVLWTRAAFINGDDLAVATYGGVDQAGSPTLGTFNREMDYPVTLVTAVPPVTGISVTPNTMQLATLDSDCPAPGKITAIDYATICWDDIPVVSGGLYVPGYAQFTDTATNYLSAPDSAELDITGDLTLSARVSLDDWTPGTAETIVAKFNVFGGVDQRSYFLRITATGALEFIWSTDGTVGNQITTTSTVSLATVVDDGDFIWAASTLDVDDGGGNHVVRFWYSSNGVVWTQLGATLTTAGTTSIFSGPASLTIGAASNGTANPMSGRISDVIVGDGIGTNGEPGGTIVFQMSDGDIPNNSANSFVATTGQTVTVTRSGSPALELFPRQQAFSAMQSSFCAWEVERRENGGDWQRIAHITERNNRCVSDYEGVIGVPIDYRVRLCRLDGTCGDWAVATGFVREGVVGTPRGCQGLIFTSNESPTSTLAYPLVFEDSPEEEFVFYDSETVVLERLHMRDYMVAFRPLERGGVQFERVLLVNAASVPPEILDRGFNEFRDFMWDTLSYVAVLDTRGNRWYAAVIVPSGSVRWTKQLYFATVNIVEITDRSSVIDVRSA